MLYAAILAGGTGSRFGSEIPKQYLDLAGKPVLIRSLEAFLEEDAFQAVLCLTPPTWVEYTCTLIEKYLPSRDIPVLSGGESRNETLMHAIQYMEDRGHLTEDAKIITHDGARPLVSRDVIRAHIDALEKASAVDTVIPATDTIVVSADGKYTREIPDRSTLFQSQTPQSFRAKKLRDYYQSLSDQEKDVLTDACRIFVMKGEAVRLVQGSSRNLKITYPEDLIMANALLNAKKY